MTYHTFIGRYVQPHVFLILDSSTVVMTDSVGDCEKITGWSGEEMWIPGELRAILARPLSHQLHHVIKSLVYPSKYLDTLDSL